jgi:hypothetical protein
MVDQEGLNNALWRKSKRSDPPNSGCISIALVDSCGAIRDSKDPEGPMIIMDRVRFRNFLRGIKQGKFDRTKP